MILHDLAARRGAAGLSLAILAVTFTGCTASQTEGDFLFLRSEGADLPIWVTGDTDSGVFLVWLTSGPGDPIAVMRGPGTDQLEQQYAMVYWDQRGCGSAQGNPDPASFTMEQFVEDTDRVVDLIRDRYDAQQIYLIGHSWGGTLATAYLLDPERQRKISGFVDLAGNHDFPLVFPMKLRWMADHARAELAAGRDVEHWSETLGWLESEPPLTVANFERWSHTTDGTPAAFFDPEQGFAVDFELLFLSPQSPLAYTMVNRRFVVEHLYRDDEVLQTFGYSSRMSAIRLPVLFLWGRHDGIVPLEAAYAAAASVGTPEEDRSIVILERSAHFPFLEEPTAFAEAVADFVEANR